MNVAEITTMPVPSLTKENFWDEVMKHSPETLTSFCKWIDEYKQRVGWDKLFDGKWDEAAPGIIGYHITKFHHIPFAMQLGIFMQYCLEMPHRYQFIEGMPASMQKMIETIFDWFYQEEKIPAL